MKSVLKQVRPDLVFYYCGQTIYSRATDFYNPNRPLAGVLTPGTFRSIFAVSREVYQQAQKGLEIHDWMDEWNLNPIIRWTDQMTNQVLDQMEMFL